MIVFALWFCPPMKVNTPASTSNDHGQMGVDLVAVPLMYTVYPYLEIVCRSVFVAMTFAATGCPLTVLRSVPVAT